MNQNPHEIGGRDGADKTRVSPSADTPFDSEIGSIQDVKEFQERARHMTPQELCELLARMKSSEPQGT